MKEALQLKNAISKANVSVRNFPLAADELRRKLKLLDGGDVYLFGTTIGQDCKVVILCHKTMVTYQEH